MSNSDSRTTKDHQIIKNWIEAREGKPAMLAGSGESGKAGELLRIKFKGQTLDEKSNYDLLPWDKFFIIFDENQLSFLYQEKTKDDGLSRFYEFIHEK